MTFVQVQSVSDNKQWNARFFINGKNLQVQTDN